jgi:hypothetical protein
MDSDFPTLSLESGRKVYADEIHISATYAGLLEGVPDDKLNWRILDRLPEQMGLIFRSAAVYVLPPEIERRTEPHPIMGGSRQVAIMPPVQLAMRFISSEPFTPDGHASQLVVVWHQHTVTPLIADSSRLRLERLNWKDNAMEFCY